MGYLRHRVGLGGSKSVVFYEVFGRLISISTQINANRAARVVNKVCMYVLLYVQICKIFQVGTNRAARFVNKVCMYANPPVLLAFSPLGTRYVCLRALFKHGRNALFVE